MRDPDRLVVERLLEALVLAKDLALDAMDRYPIYPESPGNLALITRAIGLGQLGLDENQDDVIG